MDRHWQNTHKDQPSADDKTDEVPKTPGKDLDAQHLPIRQSKPAASILQPKTYYMLQPLTISPSPKRLPWLPPDFPEEPRTASKAPTSPPIIRRIIKEPEQQMKVDSLPTHRDVAVQTSKTRVIQERTIKELLDGATVVSRVVTEKFGYE